MMIGLALALWALVAVMAYMLDVSPVLAALALVFVVLHRADGGEVLVSPVHITSLRVTSGSLKELVPHGHCVIGLTDGKFLSVMETCQAVRQLIEGQ